MSEGERFVINPEDVQSNPWKELDASLKRNEDVHVVSLAYSDLARAYQLDADQMEHPPQNDDERDAYNQRGKALKERMDLSSRFTDGYTHAARRLEEQIHTVHTRITASLPPETPRRQRASLILLSAGLNARKGVFRGPTNYEGKRINPAPEK